MTPPRFYKIAAAVLLPLFFWYFHRGVLSAHLGPDEAMNLYSYWQPPWSKTLLANVMFWSRFTRPLGALYYLPVYRAFGLNAVPYNALRTLLLLVNLGVFYQLAWRVSRSRAVALLAGFPVAYHASLGYLAWGGAFVYDVLCGGFYFAALLYYVQRRRAGKPLGIGALCIFLALYICSLDAKEMAVSLPVLVLAYELLFKKIKWDLRSLVGQFVPTLLAGAVTLIFILGKTGQGSLTDLESYRPVFTWARFSENSIHLMNELFYTGAFTMQGVVVLWAALLAIAVVRWRDPRWMFVWIWLMVTPLPIVFLPGRGGPQQYIVLAGWSMIAAMLCQAVARRIAWVGKVAGIPRAEMVGAGLALCAVAYTQDTQAQDDFAKSGMQKNGEKTLAVIEQLKELHLQPKPGSRIVFLSDPFPGFYDTQFLANLLWDDHSLSVELQQQIHYSDDALKGMDYLLDYSEGGFRVVKSPSTVGAK